MAILHIFAISIKELKVLWKDKEALALLFLMPAFFILVMSFALQGVFDTGTKKQPIRILLVNQDIGDFTKRIIEDLNKNEGLEWISTIHGKPLTPVQAESFIRKKTFSLSLIFKENFSKQLLISPEKAKDDSPSVILIADPALNTQLLSPIEGIIQSVIQRNATRVRIHYSLEQELGPFIRMMARARPGSSGRGENPIDKIFKNLEAEGVSDSSNLFITRPPSGYRTERRPTATEQNVPAYTIFGVFFIMLTLAASIYKEREYGTFDRLLTTPLSKTALLIGKLLPYHLVNLLQIALMFSIGVIVFGMHLGSLPALCVVSFSLSMCAIGLGLLIAAFSRTWAQVNGFSVLLAVTLSALGGMMVPSFVMPDTLKTISLFTPHAWALAAYHDVIIRGLAAEHILKESAVLLGFAAIFFTVALWRFRFH